MMNIDKDKRGLEKQIDSCEVDFEKKVPSEAKDLASSGSYKQHKEPKLEDTATDVYYKTECKVADSKVSIPTEDAVDKAKEWVDDENKM
jgi:hypothetical protein